MPNHDQLRYVMSAVLALFFVIGAYFRVRAHTREPLDRLQEGLPILISLRLCGLVMVVTLIFWLVNPQSFDATQLPFPLWLRWLGLPVLLAGGAWMVWMFRTLGRNLTDTVVTRRAAYLVTEGPYRLVRHPMYAAVLPLGLSIVLFTANWVFAAGSVVAFILLKIRTSKEERNLLARFGDPYRKYMERTGRFFPLIIH